MTIKDCLLAQRESSCVTTAPPLKTVTELKIPGANEIKPTPVWNWGCTMEVEVTTSPYVLSHFVEETVGEKPKVLLASVCYTKVGRKKKKQIKKQLKKQFGEQARGETFKSLLKKQFFEQFKTIDVNELYSIKSQKGLKATLMYGNIQEGSSTNGLRLSTD
jgi:hypothetical protein